MLMQDRAQKPRRQQSEDRGHHHGVPEKRSKPKHHRLLEKLTAIGAPGKIPQSQLHPNVEDDIIMSTNLVPVITIFQLVCPWKSTRIEEAADSEH